MELLRGDTDGEPLDATLAIQLVADYSGNWPARLAQGLAAPLAVAAFGAVLLAVLQAPLALLVAVAGLALGCGLPAGDPRPGSPRRIHPSGGGL